VLVVAVVAQVALRVQPVVLVVLAVCSPTSAGYRWRCRRLRTSQSAPVVQVQLRH
jgi:hypothetical protein